MRFLFILLLFFILFRVVGLVIRLMVGRPSTRNFNQPKPPGSNINVKKEDSKPAEGYKGGEYIDYEDVD